MSLLKPKNDPLHEPRFSLAIHDLRVSRPEEAMNAINCVMKSFPFPLAIHLIFDEMLHSGAPLYGYLKNGVDKNLLEVVFHGLSHECSRDSRRALSFYHKYQAEYLDDDEGLRAKTGAAFEKIKSDFGINMGICPPCWLAHRNNMRFFRNLNPLFIESLLSVSTGDKKYFSPVISLGSAEGTELFFLRILGWMMYGISGIKKRDAVRVAIHLCDIAVPSSMDFFMKITGGLTDRGYRPVLLNRLF